MIKVREVRRWSDHLVVIEQRRHFFEREVFGFGKEEIGDDGVDEVGGDAVVGERRTTRCGERSPLGETRGKERQDRRGMTGRI